MKEEAVPKWETQELQRRFQSLTLEFKKLHRVSITSSQKCPSLRTAREETEVPFSLPYGPTLTSIHDYWKNQSFDCADLCWPHRTQREVEGNSLALLPSASHRGANPDTEKSHRPFLSHPCPRVRWGTIPGSLGLESEPFCPAGWELCTIQDEKREGLP